MAKRGVNIRLRPDQEEAIDALCAADHELDRSKLIRRAVDEYLDRIRAGKPVARGGQRTAGPMDVEAARGGSGSLASPFTPPHSVNEDEPVELKPAIPAREPSPPMTRSRAVLRKMTQRETKK